MIEDNDDARSACEADDDLGGAEFCEVCGAEIIPSVNDYTECSICHALGCESCLMDGGDDCYEFVCEECETGQ